MKKLFVETDDIVPVEELKSESPSENSNQVVNETPKILGDRGLFKRAIR